MESELCDGELNQLEKVLQTVSPVLVTFHNYFMELLTEQTIERYYETFPLLDDKECLVVPFKTYLWCNCNLNSFSYSL